MRVVACGAGFAGFTVHVELHHVFFIMTVETEIPGVRNKKCLTGRAMGIMTDGAATCCQRSVQLRIMPGQSMAEKAKLFFRKNKLIRSLFVAAGAEPCRKRAVLVKFFVRWSVGLGIEARR